MPRFVVAMLLVVVLAGCGSAGPGTESTATPTATPAPESTATATVTPAATSPATPTARPSFDPTSLAGVNADGVNVSRLSAVHDDRLNRVSYRLNTTVRRGSTRLAVHVATANGSVPTYRRTERRNLTREEYYADRYYSREVVNGNVSYEVTPYVGRGDFSGGSLLREFMPLARYEPVGTDRVDGAPVVVLEAGPDDLRDGALGNVTVAQFSSRVRIDRTGVVRSFSFGATGVTDGGRPFVVRAEFRVTEVGETVVERPDWLSAAVAATRTNGTATPSDRG